MRAVLSVIVDVAGGKTILADSLMIVKNCIKSSRVVAGGGAVELEVSRHLKEFSRSIDGKEQLIAAAFAQALETIPRQLADNAGFDSTDILNRLRQKHATDPCVSTHKSDYRCQYTWNESLSHFFCTMHLGAWQPGTVVGR